MNSIFDWYYRWELRCQWTLGHTNVQLQALQTYLLLVAVFKNFLAALVIVVIGVIILAVVGWWGIDRKGLLKRQNTIANAHNLELMRASKRK